MVGKSRLLLLLLRMAERGKSGKEKPRKRERAELYGHFVKPYIGRQPSAHAEVLYPASLALSPFPF